MKPSQKQLIMDHYFNKDLTITDKQAEKEPVFSRRLAARIKDLKYDGFNIGKVMIQVGPRKKWVAKYHLIK
tara:strand:+ start:281 stop:493 length:213 start_codon:yes stop_codon:yes gene_type:complete